MSLKQLWKESPWLAQKPSNVSLLIGTSFVAPTESEIELAENLWAISIDPTAALQETVERQARASRQLLTANRELTDTVDRLREQGEDLRQAAMAAQVSAEEIETLNEELQSSNEELETLHEEAQATVEELNVANDELHARAMELEELAQEHAEEQARLSAVLGSMGDAVVVVDAQGRVMRTNAAYDDLVGTLGTPFMPADAQGLPLPAVETPEYRVARGETFRLEFTVGAADGSRRPALPALARSVTVPTTAALLSIPELPTVPVSVTATWNSPPTETSPSCPTLTWPSTYGSGPQFTPPHQMVHRL